MLIFTFTWKIPSNTSAPFAKSYSFGCSFNETLAHSIDPSCIFRVTSVVRKFVTVNLLMVIWESSIVYCSFFGAILSIFLTICFSGWSRDARCSRERNRSFVLSRWGRGGGGYLCLSCFGEIVKIGTVRVYYSRRPAHVFTIGLVWTNHFVDGLALCVSYRTYCK